MLIRNFEKGKIRFLLPRDDGARIKKKNNIFLHDEADILLKTKKCSGVQNRQRGKSSLDQIFDFLLFLRRKVRPCMLDRVQGTNGDEQIQLCKNDVL